MTHSTPDSFELDNGHVVHVGDKYTMDYDNKQLGIPAGSQLEITSITRSIGHPTIEFEATFPGDIEPMSHFSEIPSIIVDFAMKNLLDDDNGMSPAE